MDAARVAGGGRQRYAIAGRPSSSRNRRSKPDVHTSRMTSSPAPDHAERDSGANPEMSNGSFELSILIHSSAGSAVEAGSRQSVSPQHSASSWATHRSSHSTPTRMPAVLTTARIYQSSGYAASAAAGSPAVGRYPGTSAPRSRRTSATWFSAAAA